MTDILVVDDEESICFAFSQCIKHLGHTPYLASNTTDALEIVKQVTPAIIFLDQRLPGESGLSILEKIHTLNKETAVVMMTAFGTMDTAIDAVKKGAYEYLSKPVDLKQIKDIIERILKPKDVAFISMVEETSQASDVDDDIIIGSTDAISDIYKMIGLLTTNDVPVLIEGESGVGKELVARAIHNKSKRKSAPFVAINCGAMPENLLESELFGHEKGAFTGADSKKIGKFEYAKDGTIFLDEIGDLKFSLQIKLLRVLQEKTIVRVGGLKTIPVDSARVITATNKNLLDEMKAGLFRSDLYYRLQLITLKIPPLRERKADIPELVSHFIRKANKEINLEIKGIAKDALQLLMDHNWPGNARELENVIKRGSILSRIDTIGAHNIEFADSESFEGDFQTLNTSIADQVTYWFEKKDELFPATDKLYASILSIVEESLISNALEACHNNQLKASELLGMNRTTLRNKIREFDLPKKSI
ncbi:MAG: sigma-54-dependent Fis family transcriptional regulator [Deltaproteobacteria bacterium]|nr:sigma-54-dependent Fis family transcriptional regulator [Deltaproteobacteria bacterium]